MPLDPSHAQAEASRANGARSHGLRGGEFCLLPGENGAELSLLERAVDADWHPRDAFERHWASELVAAMWRQQRLRRLELKALATADAEEVISETSLKRLQTLGRYGSRLDADIGRALRALRVLKNRTAADLAEAPRTSEPERAPPAARPASYAASPQPPSRTFEPESALPAPAANRHERRRQEALARAAGRRAA